MPQPGSVLEPSLTEVSFLKSALLQSIRTDGREFLQSRKVSLEFSSELGWVQVTLGDTIVLVSTHATLVSPRPDRPYEGFVEIRSEIQPMAGLQFERGRSNEEEVLFDRGIDKAVRRSEVVDREALCVVAGFKVSYLCLYIFSLRAYL
jgi:exosome complex component RRP45